MTNIRYPKIYEKMSEVAQAKMAEKLEELGVKQLKELFNFR